MKNHKLTNSKIGGGYLNNTLGFTLIELLAIIVILAIIAVITVPIILNVIDNAERGSAEDSALGYKDALQKYYATKLVQAPDQELPSGYVEISELPSDFTVSGEKPSDGWVKLKNGIVEKYSLKYKNFVVSMNNDKNVISEKQDKVEPHVPNEYQEVEYLESTGTQYIDTGYLPNSNTKVDIKFMALDNPEGAIPLFGARTNADKKSLTVFYRTSTIGRIDYGNYSDSNPTIKFNKDTVHTFVKDKEKNYLDGKYINSNNYTDFSCDYTMYINNVNTSDSSFSKLFSSRLYYTKIYDDDLLVRNFVPVVRKSDNKPGMLDLANLSRNLFDRESQVANTKEGMHAGTPNAYLKDDGSEVSSSGWWITDFIGIYSDTVTISGVTNNTPSICLYDDNKSLLTCTRYSGNESITISASGAKYVRFSLIRNTNTSVMLNEGTEALPYEPYKKSLYTNNGTGEFITGPEI